MNVTFDVIKHNKLLETENVVEGTRFLITFQEMKLIIFQSDLTH